IDAAGFLPGEDVIEFTNDGSTMGDIVGVWDGAAGVMRFTSSAGATAAEWTAALRAVTYKNTSDAPTLTQRQFDFRVNDGTQDSTPSRATMDMQPVNDAPIITPSGATLAYTENQAATAIDPTIFVN